MAKLNQYVFHNITVLYKRFILHILTFILVYRENSDIVHRINDYF